MKITMAIPTPFQTSTSATEKSARCGIAQPIWRRETEGAQGRVDEPDGRLHEGGECDPHGDRTDQHREEDDAPKKSLEPDARREQHGQRQRNDDFQTTGDDGIDDRVAKPGQ